jgi:hypothetical protein
MAEKKYANGRSARPLRSPIICSTCFGTMGVTLPARRSYRHKRLEEIITPVSGIQVGGYVANYGKDLFHLAKEKGLEGIIAKRKPAFIDRENAHRIR